MYVCMHIYINIHTNIWANANYYSLVQIIIFERNYLLMLHDHTYIHLYQCESLVVMININVYTYIHCIIILSVCDMHSMTGKNLIIGSFFLYICIEYLMVTSIFITSCGCIFDANIHEERIFNISSLY
jgi:hypothetical protein